MELWKAIFLDKRSKMISSERKFDASGKRGERHALERVRLRGLWARGMIMILGRT